MKICAMSDLHFEFMMPREIDSLTRGVFALPSDIEVLVLAGDIGNYISPKRVNAFLYDVATNGPFKKIYIIPGNHEFYGVNITDESTFLHPNVKDLNCTYDIYNGVKFCGAIMWTDFNRGNPLDMMNYKNGINDCEYIQHYGLRLKPDFILNQHTFHMQKLENMLTDSSLATDKTVVVTHHGPTTKSVADRYIGDPYNFSFVSDNAEFVLKHQPDLWIHGHTHVSMDYMVDKTHVITNPKGYGRENPEFRVDYILEV